MTTTRELREKRQNIWIQAQEFLARDGGEGEPLSAEDEAAWQRCVEELDDLGAKIKRREVTEALDKRDQDLLDEDVDAGRRSADGLPIEPKGDDGGSIDERYNAAFGRYLRSGMVGLKAAEQDMLQERAQSVTGGAGPGEDGGYTVPDEFWARVVDTMAFYAVVADIAEVMNTGDGRNILWPTADGTAEEGEIVDENTPVTALDTAFGQASVGAYMYSSKMILASRQILQDSAIDFEAWLIRRIAQRLGRITNRHFTVGTNTNQPQGYITGGAVGVTSGGALSYDDLIDLEHSVDIAYRGTNGRFTFHDDTFKALRKLKDADGRPLWQPSLQAGVADNLNGRPYSINNHMPTGVATGVATFGDHRTGFLIRSVNGGSVLRLTERYAENLQIGFLGFGRWDSAVQDSSAYKLLTKTV